MGLIVDVSHWNTVNDWDAFIGAVDFAIVKATQGVSGTDPMYKTFARHFDEAGKPHWAYSFMVKADGAAQARNLMEYAPTATGYALDIETYNGFIPTVEQAMAAARYLVERGKKVLVYFGDYSTEYRVIAETWPGQCTNWIARYGQNDAVVKRRPNFREHVSLHQWTSVGRCPGLAGHVDLNDLWGGDKPLEWFLTREGDDEELNANEKKQLSEIHAMLTRTDNAGYENVPAGHNLFGRVCRIERQVERTDNANHKTAGGHDLYGRVNMLQEDMAVLSKQIANIQKQLKTITEALVK